MLRNFTRLSLLILLFASFNTWAVKKPKHFFADITLPAIDQGASVLVMPLNTNKLLKDNEFEDIKSELKEGGKKINLKPVFAKLPESEEFDYYMLTSQRLVAAPEAVEAKKIYANAVGENYSLVIIPSVFETTGELKGEVMKWHGVAANVKSSGTSKLRRWSGTGLAYSIRFEVYGSDGEWLMTTFGGVAMPRWANHDTNELIRKEYLFERRNDRDTMERGMKVALNPILKKFKLK